MKKIELLIRRIGVIGMFMLFKLFPIKKNRILLWSIHGTQYSCNPKYIAEYIINNNKDLECIFALNNVENVDVLDGIRKVKYKSILFYYYFCTAKVIITNTRIGFMFTKRKKQIYINTWHGVFGLKSIEKDVEESLPTLYIKFAKNDSKNLDLLISGSKMLTDIYKRSYWYDGEIFECASARNDIFYKELDKSIIDKVYKFCGLDSTKKIILYAPTYRNDLKYNFFDFDFDKIIKTFEKKYKNNYVLLIRLHPNMKGIYKVPNFGSNVIDVTDYQDMQDLLLVSDVLITDYSSSMFDFSLNFKQVQLYMPDVNSFKVKENKTLLCDPLNDLPYSVALNEEQLINNINNFDKIKYKNELKKFWKKIGSFEDGHGTENIVKRMVELINND